MSPELTTGGDGKPLCNCEECVNLNRRLEKRGEPSTWRGQRILTEHEAAVALLRYGPEPDDFD